MSQAKQMSADGPVQVQSCWRQAVLFATCCRRVRGDAYYQLLDEFLTAVRRRYGNTTLIHFSDMAHDNAAKLLNMYRTDFPCFSDELQGLGTAVLAAILGSLPKTGGSLADHTVLLSGARQEQKTWGTAS